MASLFVSNQCFIPHQVRAEKWYVLHCIEVSWRSLQYASDGLKNDKYVVLAAVRKNGLALQYASEALKRDNEVVIAAFSNDPKSLQYASPFLLSDKEFVGRFTAAEFMEDIEVVFAATAYSLRSVSYAAIDLARGGLIEYVDRLLREYNVPVSLFVATVLACATSKRVVIQRTRLLRSDLVHVARRPRCDCGVMSRLHFLGEEGKVEFLKKLAAYAGVPLKRMGCPVPWQSVRSFVITSMWFNDDGVLLKSIR